MRRKGINRKKGKISPKIPKVNYTSLFSSSSSPSKILKFKNPFRTSERKQQLYSVYKSPIHRVGITSLEKEQQERAMEKIEQLKNAGMYNPDSEAWFNVTFKDFGNTAMFPLDKDLPQGVTSVEDAEKTRSAMQQAQAFNAGIVSAKEARLKSLLKVLQKRQMKELEEKAIQYLAETDELDQVPEEYQEAVSSWYYNDLPARYRKYINVRRGQWLEKGDEGYERLTDAEKAELAWIKEQIGKEEYKKLQDRVGVMRRTQQKREERKKREKDYLGSEQEKDARDYFRKIRVQEMEGHGSSLMGWRAPYLFSLVRPHHPLDRMFKRKPEERIKEEKDVMDDLRDEYRTQQTEQRGIAPPKEMVNRAFPKTARPLIDFELKKEEEKLPVREAFIAHPFIFPHRKFSVVSFY